MIDESSQYTAPPLSLAILPLNVTLELSSNVTGERISIYTAPPKPIVALLPLNVTLELSSNVIGEKISQYTAPPLS